MPTGNAKQTILKYTNRIKGPNANKTTRDGEEESPDASTSSGNQEKRPRTEEEINTEASPSGSDTSLTNSDSRNTVIDNGEREGPFEHRSPSKSNTDKTNKSYTNLDDDAERIAIIKLERLKDKEDRYSSHISFLKECLDAKLIPNGLRIDVEPSIGNNDDKFCEKWYGRMQEFSFILMRDIIEYSESVETETADRINETKDALITLWHRTTLKNSKK